MNVIITGASRGIGYQTAKEFAKNGHHVLVLSRNLEELKKLKKECEDSGFEGSIFPEQVDLNESIQLKPLVKKYFEEVNVLINNAGSLLNKPFQSISEEELKDVYQINVFTPFKIIQQLLDLFSSHAHIINISSVGGVNGTQKFSGLSAYSSSKAAISCLTECLQAEYQDTELAFNSLALGAVQTEMLSEAFPGYEAEVSSVEMGVYIYGFAMGGSRVMKGQTLLVSRSNP